MSISVGSYVRVKNLKHIECNAAPYIDERMYNLIDKSFEVSFSGSHPDLSNGYIMLKDSPFYWLPDWVEILPMAYKYESLIRLDKEYIV